MNTTERGNRGEDEAAHHLESDGYQIVARNFRTRRGEIDIVARTGDTLAFVEVKSWRTFGADQLEYSVGHRKRQTIISCARAFLAAHREFSQCQVRFDVVFVPQGTDAIEHFPDAFESDG